MAGRGHGGLHRAADVDHECRRRRAPLRAGVPQRLPARERGHRGGRSGRGGDLDQTSRAPDRLAVLLGPVRRGGRPGAPRGGRRRRRGRADGAGLVQPGRRSAGHPVRIDVCAGLVDRVVAARSGRQAGLAALARRVDRPGGRLRRADRGCGVLRRSGRDRDHRDRGRHRAVLGGGGSGRVGDRPARPTAPGDRRDAAAASVDRRRSHRADRRAGVRIDLLSAGLRPSAGLGRPAAAPGLSGRPAGHRRRGAALSALRHRPVDHRIGGAGRAGRTRPGRVCARHRLHRCGGARDESRQRLVGVDLRTGRAGVPAATPIRASAGRPAGLRTAGDDVRGAGPVHPRARPDATDPAAAGRGRIGRPPGERRPGHGDRVAAGRDDRAGRMVGWRRTSRRRAGRRW